MVYSSLGNNPQQCCREKKTKEAAGNTIMSNPIRTVQSKREEKGKMENVKLKIN